MLAYVFPGQGSQKVGMGRDLFSHYRNQTEMADEILGYSIKSLCVEDNNHQLNQTQYTQPALYTVNALMYLKALEENKQPPDYVAGHSLGEYNALFAAGVFDFATGLKLVQKRGELMSQAKDGEMAAVLGLNRCQVEKALAQHQLSAISIANDNSYQQLVISGSKNEMCQAQNIFSNQPGIHYISLPVSGAFHSPLMNPAQKEFAKFLQNFNFSMPKIPVLSNVTAKPYHPAVITSNLTKHLSHPVQWTQTIEYLLTKPTIEFKEIGPGNVLEKLIKSIRSSSGHAILN